MTERQHDQSLLSDLLKEPHAAGQPDDRLPEPLLTRDEEQALLREANQAGIPTLAPQTLPEAGLPSSVLDALTKGEPDAPASFSGEIVAFIRRNPIPVLLTGMGLAYILSHRRRR